MNIDTVFNDCYLVDLYEEGTVVAKILWGTILVDPSGRWEPGHYACTSPIISDHGDGLFSTYNSTYLSMGTVTKVKLPAHNIIKLRAGYCPKDCMVLDVLSGKN